MEGALDAHAVRPIPLEVGRTLLEKGSLERRLARKMAAKSTLEEAIELFERIEARFWIQRAREEYARIGIRRARASTGLTPVQQRVAELVAEGMNNQEIARAVHMSTSTVEKHLTKVYRHLGVRGRSQLAAALSGGAP